MKQKTLALIALLSAPFVAVGGTPAFADASEVGAPQRVEAPMVGIGFDAAVAAANGYEIRLEHDGGEYSVPVGTPVSYSPSALEVVAPGVQSVSESKGAVTTAGTVPCGTSYIALGETTYATGYDVPYGVWWQKWGVHIESVGWEDDFNLDSGSHGPSWDWVGGVDSRHKGHGTAWINHPALVMLTNGMLCESVYPTASHFFS